MTKQELQDLIDQKIYENDKGEVTATSINDVLSGIVDNLSTNDLTDELKAAIPSIIDQEVNRKMSEYKIFPNVPGQGNWNANEMRVMPNILGLYVISRNSVYLNYAFSTIIRGSSTTATSFTFFRGTNYDTRSFGVGEVSGIVKYIFQTVPGDYIVFWVDWDNSTMPAGTNYTIGTFRAAVSKQLYRTIITETTELPDLILPPYVPVALGRELPIWKESIRSISDTNECLTRTDFIGSVLGIYDADYNRTFKYQIGVLGEAMPAIPSDFTVSIINKNKDGAQINSSLLSIRHTSNVFNSSATKTILMIGDSHMAEQDRQVTRELKKLIVDNGSFIPTFIGTQFLEADPTIRNEGRGGWTTRRFCESGSPFYIGGKFDFSAYMSARGYSSCDIVTIHLGANDMFSANNVTVAEYTSFLQIMFTSIWLYNPQMKIIVSMPMRGAMGRSDGDTIKLGIVPYINALKTLIANTTSPEPYNKSLICCPSYIVTNRVTDWGAVTPSQRDGTVNFLYGSQHLNIQGYKRVADLMFSSIMYALNN